MAVRGRVKSNSQPIHPEVEIELEKAPQSEKDQAGEEKTVVTPRVRMHELLHRPFDVRSFATTGLFVLAIFYTIYFLRSLLLPIVLALLLSYLLRPIVRILVKARIPSLLGAALVMALLVGLMGYGISFLATPASEWIEKAPYSLHELKQKMLPIKKPMEKVAQASGAIESLTATDNQQNKTPTVEVKQHPLTDRLMGQTPELMVSALTTLILLYFLLAYDGVFLGKLIKLMPTLSDKKRAVSIAQRDRNPGFPLLVYHHNHQHLPGSRGRRDRRLFGPAESPDVGHDGGRLEFRPLSRRPDRHHLHDVRRGSEF